MGQKGLAHLLLLLIVVAVLLILGLVAYFVFLKPILTPPAQTQLEYQNPFSKTDSYQNPFLEYHNPFEDLQ